jgi:hypothetical protein
MKLMKLFRRKSKWDRVMDVAETALAKAEMGRVTKVTAGVIGGARAATAASAAISSIRHQGDS